MTEVMALSMSIVFGLIILTVLSILKLLAKGEYQKRKQELKEQEQELEEQDLKNGNAHSHRIGLLQQKSEEIERKTEEFRMLGTEFEKQFMQMKETERYFARTLSNLESWIESQKRKENNETQNS